MCQHVAQSRVLIKDGGCAGMKRCVGEEETCIYWQRLYPAEEKQYQREGEAPHVSQEPGASPAPSRCAGYLVVRV